MVYKPGSMVDNRWAASRTDRNQSKSNELDHRVWRTSRKKIELIGKRGGTCVVGEKKNGESCEDANCGGERRRPKSVQREQRRPLRIIKKAIRPAVNTEEFDLLHNQSGAKRNKVRMTLVMKYPSEWAGGRGDGG